jgi:hypothetical protein
MKRETIDVFAGDKKVGYVYPEYIHIDDFTTLDKYVDREMNFTVIKRNHSRLQAVLNFIN